MVPKVVINSPSGEPGNHLESNGTASNGTIQSNGHVAPAFRDPDTQGAFDLLEEMSKNEKGKHFHLDMSSCKHYTQAENFFL